MKNIINENRNLVQVKQKIIQSSEDNQGTRKTKEITQNTAQREKITENTKNKNFRDMSPKKKCRWPKGT